MAQHKSGSCHEIKVGHRDMMILGIVVQYRALYFSGLEGPQNISWAIREAKDKRLIRGVIRALRLMRQKKAVSAVCTRKQIAVAKHILEWHLTNVVSKAA